MISNSSSKSHYIDPHLISSAMRIRGRKPVPDGSLSLSSPSLSPSSSISSYSSSSIITAANSSASSQDSSNSCPHPSSHRWHGLDLLVKAIHQVTAGSIIGVPYIQRRVTTRSRRRRLGFDSDAFVFDGLPQRRSSKRIGSNDKRKKSTTTTTKRKMKKEMGLPIAAQDSVLHSWVGRSDLAG